MRNHSKTEFGNLQNVKVLSAGSVIAGPFVCALFAEQGADVIQIESALAPDVLRGFGDNWSMEHRNERDIALNITSPEGREILSRLVKWCNILVESSKGGTWENWGLTDEVLWEMNPRLVIVHVSSFGQYGDPGYVSRAGFDVTGQAFSGYMLHNGMPDPAPPLVLKPYTCDYVTGLTAAWAALAALIRTRETGVGESIDIAQFEAMARIQAEVSLDGFNKGKEAVRMGNANPVVATDGTYRCKDGNWVVVSMSGFAILKRGLPIIGLDNDPDFAEVPQLVLRSNAVQAEKYLTALRTYCADHTADEVDRALNDAQVPCSKVMTYRMMLEDPHYQARETVVAWDDPKMGAVKGIGTVPKFKKNPGRIFRGSPTYGMDNETVLSEFGYSEKEIEALYEKKVINKKVHPVYAYI